MMDRRIKLWSLFAVDVVLIYVITFMNQYHTNDWYGIATIGSAMLFLGISMFITFFLTVD